MKRFYDFMLNEDGATLIEYGIITGLIVLVALATLRALGVSLSGSLSNVVFS